MSVWGNDSSGNTNASSDESKEWKLIEKAMLSMQDEQRKQRRWGIFFKALTFVYLFVLLASFTAGGRSGLDVPSVTEPHTAIIDVTGVIAANADASADVIVTGLRKAFEAENAEAVIIRLNSPGGSPVQSGYVYREIKRLRGEYPDKKVYAVISDMGASGAYYIAAAADEIYADKASIVGSIGVIMAGFGFEDAMEKLGVERRVMTAGDNKALLDPFSPVGESEKQHVQAMLDQIHQQFIDAVKNGRGDRLQDNADIFSGLFWTGEEAVELGLVDGLASSGEVARDIIGFEDLVDYTARPDPLQKFLGQFGTSIGEGIANQLGMDSLR